MDRETRYWLGVIVKDHIARGVAGGFIQLNHGKKRPLQRMAGGDWIVVYSPRLTLEGNEPCQAFTALGRIRSGEIYRHAMSDGFVPYRVDVDYLPGHDAPIRPLIGRLSFIENKQHWGLYFRAGHREIPRADFLHVAAAMGVDTARLPPAGAG